MTLDYLSQYTSWIKVYSNTKERASYQQFVNVHLPLLSPDEQQIIFDEAIHMVRPLKREDTN